MCTDEYKSIEPNMSRRNLYLKIWHFESGDDTNQCLLPTLAFCENNAKISFREPSSVCLLGRSVHTINSSVDVFTNYLRSIMLWESRAWEYWIAFSSLLDEGLPGILLYNFQCVLWSKFCSFHLFPSFMCRSLMISVL